MKKSIYFVLFISYLFVGLIACEEETVETTTVNRPVYLCCNPWDEEANQTTEGNIKDIVQTFLEASQVEVFNIDSIQEGEQVECIVCCECPAGFNVYVDIAAEDTTKAFNLGFEK